MFAIRTICLLKKVELNTFALCSAILNRRSLISTTSKRSRHSLLSTRLKLHQSGITLTKKLCTARTLDEVSYHNTADETLDALAELFEDLGESPSSPTDYDVQLSDGVLTVNLGGRGTYVINKQSPNRQIWLSSPTSGPKRYDLKNGSWIYTHDGACLHNLLSSEISLALGHEVDFTLLPHGGADKNG
ncbi:frataxin, mitochondrial-like isoform X2 [Orbicella faveolata]|uniref:frataxin, mitochondrial-like isoform X2 n=1 Tax=Orbicella faveolata TaxID=48498 RepID=UPI0009E25F3F|nr:frataxin, mitochondrial-like isoform X2 [Orbicella faveolata]